MQFEVKAIGMIRSCFTSKFGIPRQPGLVESATATLELSPPYNKPETLRGIEAFSHLWITFVFHETARADWKATVRPPRLGGNERIGVFASRSNFRPNPIGLSVVELVRVEGTALHLAGGDFLDGTPVLDIKPYLPYGDSIPDAKGAFASAPPTPINDVKFTPKVDEQLVILKSEDRPLLRQLIAEMLAFNPRPAYQHDDPDRVFGTTVFDLEVRWKQAGNRMTVVEVVETKS